MQHDGIRGKLYTIIFEAHTPAGKAFDVALFITIGISVVSIMLESVPALAAEPAAATAFRWIEIITTLLFSIEYVLRLWCSPQPVRYAGSFYGIIDLLSVVPFYFGPFLPGGGSLAIIRSLRLLRVFRVLKLSRFLVEGNVLWISLIRSSRKVGVFLFTVLLITIIMGTLMYTIEGPENGFTSIPLSVYWAIVTLTTVGYGDIAPHTIPGQFLASLIMILGYAIIAVPTGIVSVDLAQNATPISRAAAQKRCENCGESADPEDRFCRNCGAEFHDNV